MAARRLLSAMVLTLAFSSLPAQAAEKLDAKAILPELAAMGITAQVTKLTDPRMKELYEAEDRYYLDIQLGKLTQEKFTKLKALFDGKSQVPFDAKRDYSLIDFIHPAMQATANQVFVPLQYDTEKLDKYSDQDKEGGLFPLRKSGLAMYANCWNTTTEILRLLHPERDPKDTQYFIYWPGRFETNEWFTDEDYSDAVTEADVRFGDALVVSRKEVSQSDAPMLQHTAMILTKNLVFEKTDLSENDAYRISLRKDVLAKYTRLFEEDGGAIIAYRRFGGPGKKQLGTPSFEKSEMLTDFAAKLVQQIFKVKPEQIHVGCETGLGGGCDLTYTVVANTKVVTNPKTGRGILYAEKAVLDRFQSLKGK